MKAPVGAVVSIYYDARRVVAQGDAIVTRTGRTYLVVSVRRQERGLHRGRHHIKALIQEKPPEGAKVHTLRWYRRGRS